MAGRKKAKKSTATETEKPADDDAAAVETKVLAFR
jgi:hypothetical protein